MKGNQKNGPKRLSFGPFLIAKCVLSAISFRLTLSRKRLLRNHSQLCINPRWIPDLRHTLPC